ncbi:hypothetical protein E2C01_008142 [Portunus trituberculatus]|uniref:Uncharacterized protein n=1 Tax=Portunus trituberculatus TaxID=210409 RepID=A0A5B7D210_PORTR|nr:hypothetical protein [Portunus trituberculatus]
MEHDYSDDDDDDNKVEMVSCVRQAAPSQCKSQLFGQELAVTGSPDALPCLALSRLAQVSCVVGVVGASK